MVLATGVKPAKLRLERPPPLSPGDARKTGRPAPVSLSPERASRDADTARGDRDLQLEPGSLIPYSVLSATGSSGWTSSRPQRISMPVRWARLGAARSKATPIRGGGESGAGDGIRTRIPSLEGWCSTFELRTRRGRGRPRTVRGAVGVDVTSAPAAARLPCPQIGGETGI